jgi:phenylpyruvate tautomerase PptA (4-oxalocrotonate tautomerase family)
MPLLRVQTSAQVDEGARQGLLLALSKKIAEILGKPEAYVMVVLEPGTPMSMAGSVDPAAFFDVRSVGEIGADTAKQLSAELSGVIGSTLGIKTDRIFGNFAGWQGGLWAYSGAPLR